MEWFTRFSEPYKLIDPPQPPQSSSQIQKEFFMCSPEDIAERTNINSESCPLYTFIGNDKAKKRISRACYTALLKPDHSMGDFSFALIGPASVGKTTLAKLIASTTWLPLAIIEPKIIKNVSELLEKILEQTKITILNGVMPPIIVFIDEVHNLSSNIVQGLLKATEKDDGMLDVGDQIVDCRNICWIIATTERGKLFSPFDSRFTKISLNLYTQLDIAKIVYLGMKKQVPLEACKLISYFAGRIPREAIAFAEEVIAEKRRNPEENWEDIVKTIAQEMEIDEFGMTEQRLRILKAVGQGPVSKNRLCNVARCQIEELEKYILPALLDDSDENPALITISSRGFVITEHGRKELDRRKITHIAYGEEQ